MVYSESGLKVDKSSKPTDTLSMNGNICPLATVHYDWGLALASHVVECASIVFVYIVYDFEAPFRITNNNRTGTRDLILIDNENEELITVTQRKTESYDPNLPKVS